MQAQSKQPTRPMVAVLGAGRMGGPMAVNLLRAGFPVRAFDAQAAQREWLAQQGVSAVDSVPALLAGAEVLITMLPSDAVLQQVAEQVLPLLSAEMLWIDMATSQLATSQRLAQQVAERGAYFLDAPVSGGERGAQAASLSIMVGGERAVYERALPVLEALGSTVTYIGGAGMGLIAKFVNQMLMEATFCTVAEAFAMAAKAGADVDAVYQAVRNGFGGSPVLDQVLPQWLAGNLGTGRELTLHQKDGSYALAAAQMLGVPTPITEATHGLFNQAVEAGHGHESAAAIGRLFEQWLGVRLVADSTKVEE